MIPAPAMRRYSAEVPAQVIAIASLKRGAGTTTTACVLGAAASASGLRVAALDLDPRGGLSAALQRSDGMLTLADVLRGDVTLRDALLEHPSGMRVVAAHRGLAEDHPSEERLRALLRGLVEDVDLVLLDTAAHAALLPAPLAVADGIVVPAGLDILSQRGAVLTIGLARRLGVADRFRGIVVVGAEPALSPAAQGLLGSLQRSGLAFETGLAHDQTWRVTGGVPSERALASGRLLLRELAVRAAPVEAARGYAELAQGRPLAELVAASH